MDKVYYYNRNGILMLTFNEAPYFLGKAEFKDWELGYDEKFGRFRNFRRNKKEYPLTVTITSRDLADRDRLYEVFEEDLQAGEPGYLMIRGWKLPCFIVEASHNFYGTLLDYQIKFKAVSETSTWTRETTKSFNGISTGAEIDLGRDYAVESSQIGRGYDEYIVDGAELMNSFGELLVDSNGDTLENSSGITGTPGYGYSVISDYAQILSLPMDGNGFRVLFYGPVTNPVIYLDGKPVRMYITLAAGERLAVISNGKERNVYKYSAAGVKTDAFVYRDKEHSPFFSIGKSTELTYGEVKFDFTTIEQRSEPSWN